MRVFFAILTSLLFLSLLGLGACSSTETPSRYHSVKAGETLDSVAALYGVDIWDLASANHLNTTEQISPGSKLFVPYDMSKLRGYQNRMELPLPQGFAFQWPLEKNHINDYFGWRRGRMHEGLDLKAVTGTPVYAAADGKVIYVGSKLHGYGKIVIIEHPENWSSIYGHLSNWNVQQGTRVHRGDLIAKSGRTGRVSGPHLHFELRKGADPVDPLLFLPPLKGPTPASQELNL